MQTIAEILKRRRGTLAATVAIISLAVLGGLYAIVHRVSSRAPAATGGAPTIEDLQIVQLTFNGNAGRAAISPDAKYVAYVQQEEKGRSLWIRQIATERNVQIIPPDTADELLGATVTPDGNYVDFVRRRGAGLTALYSLWRVPLLGGTPRVILQGVTSLTGWSPDGSRMAFIRLDLARDPITTTLLVADADGSHERVLSTRTAPRAYLCLGNGNAAEARPVWSPDGHTIALIALAAGGPSEIVLVNSASGKEATLPMPTKIDVSSGPEWVDDTTIVALGQTEVADAAVQLWRFSYPDGRSSRLTNDVSSYSGVSLASDGTTLVTTRREQRSDIWVGDGRGERGREVVAPVPIVGNQLRVSWAATRLLYTPRSDVLSVDPETGEWATIAAGGGNAAATPDGQTVVFASRNGDPGLWKVSVGVPGVTRLVEGHASSPQITPDAGRVVFQSTRTGVQSPWIVPLAGGEPRQVTNTLMGRFDISPDGQSIVFGAGLGASTMICRLPDCSGQRTLPIIAGGRRIPKWTRDGRGIAYVSGSNLWVEPLDGEARYQLTHFTDSRAIEDYAWSPDGTRLAVSRSTTTNDIVLIKGLRR